jgi:co-chaperonin GroES (HSP10)
VVSTFRIRRKKSRSRVKWLQSARASAMTDGKVNALDVQVGDRILFGKYSGSDIKLDGNEYLIMREDEVLGVFTNGASNGASKAK